MVRILPCRKSSSSRQPYHEYGSGIAPFCGPQTHPTLSAYVSVDDELTFRGLVQELYIHLFLRTTYLASPPPASMSESHTYRAQLGQAFFGHRGDSFALANHIYRYTARVSIKSSFWKGFGNASQDAIFRSTSLERYHEYRCDGFIVNQERKVAPQSGSSTVRSRQVCGNSYRRQEVSQLSLIVSAQAAYGAMKRGRCELRVVVLCALTCLFSLCRQAWQGRRARRGRTGKTGKQAKTPWSPLANRSSSVYSSVWIFRETNFVERPVVYESVPRKPRDIDKDKDQRERRCEADQSSEQAIRYFVRRTIS